MTVAFDYSTDEPCLFENLEALDLHDAPCEEENLDGLDIYDFGFWEKFPNLTTLKIRFSFWYTANDFDHVSLGQYID